MAPASIEDRFAINALLIKDSFACAARSSGRSPGASPVLSSHSILASSSKVTIRA